MAAQPFLSDNSSDCSTEILLENISVKDKEIVTHNKLSIIRWFKFTLKPPYTVASGNLLLAIWDTSHWTSFVKFGLKTA